MRPVETITRFDEFLAQRSLHLVRPTVTLTGDALTAAMVGIGMNFAAKAAKNPNIEDTLLFASKEALEKDDLRVLSVLVTWLGVHAAWINADRLICLIAEESPRVRAFWAGVGHWLKADRRFARVPANVLRDRAADVLSPAELAKRHRTYRQRVMKGPSYRADLWGALQADPSLSAAELRGVPVDRPA